MSNQKVTDAQIGEIRQRLQFESAAAIARAYGISPSAVSHIKYRETGRAPPGSLRKTRLERALARLDSLLDTMPNMVDLPVERLAALADTSATSVNRWRDTRGLPKRRPGPRITRDQT